MKTPQVLSGFIVLEGLDGAGTTTQRDLLVGRLKDRDVPCVATCEPTNGPIGTLIRSVLRREAPTTPQSLAYLFAADRHNHLFSLSDGIVSALESGRIVVSDRYVFSSLAYQSVQCGFELVAELNAQFPLPELVVFVEVPVDVAVQRSTARGPSELFEHTEFQERVKDMYERAFGRYPSALLNMVRIDGTLPVAAVQEKIWSAVRRLPKISM